MIPKISHPLLTFNAARFLRLGQGRGRARPSSITNVCWFPPGLPKSADSQLPAPGPLANIRPAIAEHPLAGPFAVGIQGAAVKQSP
ncbi:MAG: hypothetical protein QOF90_3667 [Acetobacteraceae bacterium]|jgi:hypothetical protein|nr:hypothetical protein [Acetobacteraceae bacterium]MEA2792464.1 hypothetical protein [Acetobacteraceae bacterium]